VVTTTVAPPHGSEQVTALLNSPEITRLISDLQESPLDRTP